MNMPTRIALVLVAPLAVAAHLSASGPQADAKVTEILAAARQALGGDAALAKVQTLTVTGATRRIMGEREIAGDVTLDFILPDKMKRTDSFGIPGGPTMERVSVLNGGEVWDDSTNRGGGGFMMRMGGGPGGPGAPGGPGREPTEEERQRIRAAQAQRMKNEMARHALAFLLRTDAPVAYAGEAEAEDGKADVIDVTPLGGTAMKLFIDQATHLPLMVSYEGVLPRMMVARSGQRPTPEEIEKMRSEPPQKALFEVRYSDYKKVDGVLLPHLVTTGANGNVTEEWTIDKFKLNPALKPESFVKKGS
jgi:hypothetical protein